MVWSLRWSLFLSSAVDGQSSKALSSNAYTTFSLSALTITFCISLSQLSIFAFFNFNFFISHSLHRRRFVGAVFGHKCTDAILSVEYYCCDRPNPILQVRLLFSISIHSFDLCYRCIEILRSISMHEFISLLRCVL